MRLTALALTGALLLLVACGGDGESGSASTVDPAAETESRIDLVSPFAAADFLADAPDDVVVLDVRTPDEFASGHLEGAINVDFYEPGFADDIGALDPSASYVVYCRSGNRSGQAATLMADLGFESVRDVDGGVIAWTEAGLPLTAG